MPDNLAERCLETFLRRLVTDEAVWDHAVASVRHARDIGAKCKDVHLPKADLYTYLSWQDEPGQSPGAALTQRILDPKSPHAQPFVDWFRKLYEL
jgi:hypothetical protein